MVASAGLAVAGLFLAAIALKGSKKKAGPVRNGGRAKRIPATDEDPMVDAHERGAGLASKDGAAEGR